MKKEHFEKKKQYSNKYEFKNQKLDVFDIHIF